MQNFMLVLQITCYQDQIKGAVRGLVQGVDLLCKGAESPQNITHYQNFNHYVYVYICAYTCIY